MKKNNYWDYALSRFFNSSEQFRYKKRLPFLISILRPGSWKGKKILEVGCGLGFEALKFAKAGAFVYAIDSSNIVIKYTKQRLANYKAKVIKMNAQSLKFPGNYFDMVYSLGVIHHIKNTERVVNEIYRVLKPNGKLILMVSHKYTPTWLIYKMEKLLRTEKTSEASAPIVKFYTRNTLKKLLRKFEIKKIFCKEMRGSLISKLILPVENYFGFFMYVICKKPVQK
jgi:ubiquinone/menaquinone biosynthesis C-methylase UbiE